MDMEERSACLVKHLRLTSHRWDRQYSEDLGVSRNISI